MRAAHIELDTLCWRPDWVRRTVSDFRARVEEATSTERWVVDGNHTDARDIVWRRATHVIWLNYSFPVVFSRAFSRTVYRAATRQEILPGNSESWRRAFLSRNSILLWVLATFRRNRVQYRALRESAEWQHLRFVEFRRPVQAAAFTSGLAGSAAAAWGAITGEDN